ncbi:hypothetical protein Nepgr_010389 [Nepenthes gracilis]|uniref:dCTP pyrophosphatase 1 n=1 Tax=Nepenthes gracilis TaxID=150966 RepID=A0AAD3XLA0_NEPGR|nr:hypothetical protein Nepgr_010389 [Nepenthes gracilis]
MGGVDMTEESVKDISLKDLSRKIEEFAKARDWEKYHSPRNLLLAMVGEVGELSEIFQWRGEVDKGLPNWEESEKEHLGEELSDVLLYLVRKTLATRLLRPPGVASAGNVTWATRLPPPDTSAKAALDSLPITPAERSSSARIRSFSQIVTSGRLLGN